MQSSFYPTNKQIASLNQIKHEKAGNDVINILTSWM